MKFTPGDRLNQGFVNRTSDPSKIGAVTQQRGAASAIPKKISPTDFAKLNSPFENFVALGVIAMVIGIFVLCRLYWDENIYTPEEGLGYYMGMIGGIMMLVAYIYSLRKYSKFLRAIGRIKYWLRLHIILGISGPTLVMVHSTFHIGSLNGGMALISMLLVVLSGVVGRYLYSKVHYGLYGRKAQLKEIQQILWLKESGIKSRLSLTPHMSQRLQEFEKDVTQPATSMSKAAFALFSIWWTSRKIYVELSREMVSYLKKVGQFQGLNDRAIDKRVRYARRMLWFYLHTVGQVVKFSAYERLLSLWRMVHVPLLYLLFISGVVHVIAVHMY